MPWNDIAALIVTRAPAAFGWAGVAVLAASALCAATPTPPPDSRWSTLYRAVEICAGLFGYAKDRGYANLSAGQTATLGVLTELGVEAVSKVTVPPPAKPVPAPPFITPAPPITPAHMEALARGIVAGLVQQGVIAAPGQPADAAVNTAGAAAPQPGVISPAGVMPSMQGAMPG